MVCSNYKQCANYDASSPICQQLAGDCPKQYDFWDKQEQSRLLRLPEPTKLEKIVKKD